MSPDMPPRTSAKYARHYFPAFEKSWQATAWLCERKWPHLFAFHLRQHRTTDANNKPIYAELTRNNSWPASRAPKISPPRHRLAGNHCRMRRLPVSKPRGILTTSNNWPTVEQATAGWFKRSTFCLLCLVF
jgi:hypothetical protein